MEEEFQLAWGNDEQVENGTEECSFEVEMEISNNNAVACLRVNFKLLVSLLGDNKGHFETIDNRNEDKYYYYCIHAFSKESDHVKLKF